jgi:superfamily II DNA helicase RecQ
MSSKSMSVLSVLSVFALLIACSHNPNKAEKIDTEMERSEAISGDESLGVKEGNLIVQKKVKMNEELRRIQNEVYSLEDRVYGNRKYESEGLYGSLKLCRAKLVSKEMGGNGKLMWTEPLDRITDKEDEFDIGIDEKDKIVGVSEEFLKDRLARFKGYKSILQKREDEYQEKLEVCDAKLAAKNHKSAVKDTADRALGEPNSDSGSASDSTDGE